MTWKEFKEAVDKQLQEKDISEDEPIWFIDTSGAMSLDVDEVHVSLDEDMGIAIS